MCEHNRRLEVGGKVSDMCGVTFVPAEGDDIDHNGYVPSGLGIGRGDYLDLTICLDCKQVVDFPTLTDEEIVEALDESY
jgi:hypothetical protein